MRLLVTGADGFTGRQLLPKAKELGWEVAELSADLTDAEGVRAQVLEVEPTGVVHLAGISAVTHADVDAFYRVNLFGTLNLLDALKELNQKPRRVLLASSANVYGNAEGLISESVCPKPVNHYAMSKLAMEHMALTYSDSLPIVITRPFNYTGVGHDNRFVIPKIVEHFARHADVIELGSLTVEREYNDVRTVCDAYLKLLENGRAGEIYNVCSGRPIALDAVLETMVTIAGYRPEIKVNPLFIRPNEIQKLYGDAARLERQIGLLNFPDLEETIKWMFFEAMHKRGKI